MEIERIFIHNHYNDDNVEFDIALLKLAEPLDLSTFIPICLPKRDSTFVGSHTAPEQELNISKK